MAITNDIFVHPDILKTAWIEHGEGVIHLFVSFQNDAPNQRFAFDKLDDAKEVLVEIKRLVISSIEEF